MRLILDNNILFSLMKPDSMNSFLFENANSEFFAPSFIIEEFDKYEKECLRKSGLSKKEFGQWKKDIFSKINFVKFEYFKEMVKIARNFCPDEDDVFYFAICLKLNLPLWSNDKKLREQDKIVVLDTEDLIEMIN